MNPENPSDSPLEPTIPADQTETKPEAVEAQAESATISGHDAHSLSVFVPFLILGLSYCIFLVWQLANVNTQHTALERTIQQQEAQVQQSGRVQGALTKLYQDLIETAKTENDAKAVVQKYNSIIHLNGPQEPGK